MQTEQSNRQSREAHLAKLEQRMDQIEAEAGRAGKNVDTQIHAQLDVLRTRAAALKTRLDQKIAADDKESDAALVELDHLVNSTYEELMTWPKGTD